MSGTTASAAGGLSTSSSSWRLRASLFAALFLSVLVLPALAQAAPGDIGFEGPSTVGAGPAPSGSKPESKLWWNDGFWWGSLWHRASGDFHIFRLDVGSQTWVDTGVVLDDRASTRADTLWDAASGKLYVASHRFSESPASGYPSRLYRFSYNSATDTYTRDAGFPVAINNWRTETLVIEKDSTGQLWATWTQGGTVWVNRSLCTPGCNDASWGTPMALGVPNVKSDDISSLIAFGGNRVGLMWSNQNNWTFGFAIHQDSAADDAWSVETALSGTGLSDDHINLKAGSDGRVYAAIKTSKTSNPDPLTMLLVRGTNGGWSSHVFGREQDDHTRPIVVLDEANNLVRMYATDSGSGGSIMEKTSPLDAISFPVGKGTPVITDADGVVNNATSTKQNPTPTTGLVLLSHSSNVHYMHSFQSLRAGGTPPVASFSASPTSGVAPLMVQFEDTSTGTVDSRAWDFQNDGTVDSTAASPSFTYTSAGSYTAKLTVTNAFGSTSATRTITVSEPSGSSTLTFTPADDAYVRQQTPDENAGAAPTLRIYKNGGSDTQSYLKFNVSGVSGTVSSVKLRLWVNNPSANTGSVYAVPNTTWNESTITWQNRPAAGPLLAPGRNAPDNTWVEFDLTGAVTTNATYTFLLKDGIDNTAWYDSKEAANDPELVVTSRTSGGGDPPVASFSASPTSGAAPLAVDFADTSTGTVESRAWDFQNDGTVDSTAASPSFTYTSAGSYTAKLTVTNTFGSTSATRTITVSEPSGSSTLTFTPADDAYVRQQTPDENAGAAPTLRIYKNGGSDTQSYLKFNVSGVSGTVSSVKLRLWVNNPSANTGSVYAVPNTTWNESTITWQNRPAAGSLLAPGRNAPDNTWVEFDLTGAVTTNATYTFLLKDGIDNTAWYDSKEAANDPELVVTFGS